MATVYVIYMPNLYYPLVGNMHL